MIALRVLLALALATLVGGQAGVPTAVIKGVVSVVAGSPTEVQNAVVKAGTDIVQNQVQDQVNQQASQFKDTAIRAGAAALRRTLAPTRAPTKSPRDQAIEIAFNLAKKGAKTIANQPAPAPGAKGLSTVGKRGPKGRDLEEEEAEGGEGHVNPFHEELGL
jgi:hypothetical protein